MLLNELMDGSEIADSIMFHPNEVRKLLSEMDWAYDIDINDEPRFERGKRTLKKISALFATFNKDQLYEATELWEEYCPWAANVAEGALQKRWDNF